MIKVYEHLARDSYYAIVDECKRLSLPFGGHVPQSVTSLACTDAGQLTIEHLSDAPAMLAETRRVLRRGGDLYARTVNRYSALPEPHVNVWGVGYVPRRWADRYVRWRSGQRYEHHRLLSSRELRRGLQTAGFRDVRVEPASLLGTERARMATRAWVVGAYDRARGNVVGRRALRVVAPLLEASGVAS